jgi:hypothetical protein
MNPTQSQLLDVVFHQLLSRRNPEEYLRTCKSAEDPEWIPGMMAALEYVRSVASARAMTRGEEFRLCSCCRDSSPCLDLPATDRPTQTGNAYGRDVRRV